MKDRLFNFSFSVGFVLDDKLIDLILACIKSDVHDALVKNGLFYSNLIYSKNIKCVEVNSSVNNCLVGDIKSS